MPAPYNRLWAALRNRPPAGDEAARPGAAAVPAGRYPAPAGRLAAVRAAVFGADPDDLMLDHRARQLLGCAWAGTLAGLARDLDPALAVNPFDPGLVRGGAFGVATDPGVTVWGRPAEPDALGRCVWRFAVTVALTDPLQAAGPALFGPTLFAPTVFAAELFGSPGSAPVAAAGQPLGDTGLVAAPPAAVGTYRVEVRLRPARDAAAVVAAADAAGAGWLFAGDGVYARLRAAWEGDSTPERAGALGVALALRTEEAAGGV